MVNNCLVPGFGVTKQWVEDTMSSHYKENVKVSEVEILKVCGYMSAIARVHLNWTSDKEELPKSVVAKIPSSLAAEEAWKKSGSTKIEQESADPIHEYMHNMEIAIYTMFTEYPPAGLKFPKYYGSLPMTTSPVLLIEDIVDTTIVDLVDGFSENQLYQIVDQIVALHKWSKQNESVWKKKVTFEMEMDPDGSMFGGALLAMMDQLANDAPELAGPVETLKINYCNRVTWIKDEIDRATKSGNAMFNHGDLWAPQILWNGEKVASIVDWALCRPGFRSEDLLRVLTTCCTVEQRRKLTDPLLQYYVDRMDGAVTLKQMKEDFVSILPYSCANMAFAICMWSNSPVLRRGEDDDDERVAEMRRRFICAIEDTADACGWRK